MEEDENPSRSFLFLVWPGATSSVLAPFAPSSLCSYHLWTPKALDPQIPCLRGFAVPFAERGVRVAEVDVTGNGCYSSEREWTGRGQNWHRY